MLPLLSLIACVAGLSFSPTHATTLNDIHSQLNPTEVSDVRRPRTLDDIRNALRDASALGLPISLSGGRHSMGGQQFAKGALHLDLTAFNRVLEFDGDKGWIEVEPGIQWPELIDWLQKNHPEWAIRQKQTGADRLSLGGALSSNIHGRGLKMRPFIDDVESFEILMADGELRSCSRTQNPELFRLAIGGYGLFGVVTKIRLRLSPTTTLERVVTLSTVDDFIALAKNRVRDGFLYGDFQFSIDSKSKDFLRSGVASFYHPVDRDPQTLPPQKELNAEDWVKLIGLAHNDKAKAFEEYSKYYLSTNHQLYRSDTHQLGVYVDDYHHKFQHSDATEMISEIYVPRDKLATLFRRLRHDLRARKTNVIYGTIRLIEPDRESFLPWAKQDYAATVFNFHVEHTPEGLRAAKRDFQLLIDRALELGGSYYLTYHRWARKDQVLNAYPQMPKFLEMKKKYDPNALFQSEWSRAMTSLLAAPKSKD